MKMKLAQRLLIGYYTVKIKVIGLISPRQAATTAFRIFCTPFAGKARHNLPQFFQKAEKLFFDFDGMTIRGYRWQPSQRNDKKILLVHGFSSAAYKFEKYVQLLQKQGFEVVAFDGPAHGSSDGKIINAYIYRNVLLQIESLYGPFNGMMGHSLGGLAASLAFEKMPNREKRKLVLVAPATETETAIQNFLSMIPVNKKIEQAFRHLIVDISGKPIHYFSVSRVVLSLVSPLLWVQDRHDTICPFKDVSPLLSLNMPHIQFLITENLGHSRVYKDSKVCGEIVSFFGREFS
jgi:pimeloyl-ACP methyl ester carboxylesterase